MPNLYNKSKVKELPSYIRDILNPNKEMPSSVLFDLRESSFTLWFILSLVFGIPALIGGTLIITGFINDIFSGTEKNEDWAIIPVVTFPLIGISLSFFIASIRGVLIRLRIKNGRWRRGVFFLHDAILVREKSNLCYLIPHELIQKIDERLETYGAGKSKSNSVTEIHFQNLAGYIQRVDLFTQDYNHSGNTIFDRTLSWHKNPNQLDKK